MSGGSDAAQFGPPSRDDPRVDRSIVISKAAQRWASEIVDLGGRNNLLFYRDLKVGTIDLSPSDRIRDGRVRMLLAGTAIRLSQLVEQDELAALARRARTIRSKADENNEERGLQTLFIAFGMATWNNTRTDAVPAAPVLLAPLLLAPRGGAAEDFDLDLDGEWQVNPTLLQLLRVDFGLDVDPDDVLGDEEPPRLQESLTRLRDRCRGVAGFDIAPRIVIGNFSYAKQPLAHDLETSGEAMTSHPIVAAIAGVEEAQHDLVASQPVAEVSEPDHVAPTDEFLILDADASQSYVINAAVRGANLVVQGPPGTGKSQTIANLIATLAARGKSTLFVAEKRAAIEAVTNRLSQSGLDSLLLDLHGGTRSRRATLQQIAASLDAIGSVPAVDSARRDATLTRTRQRLNDFKRALHEPRSEDSLSVYEMQSELLAIPQTAHCDLVLPQSTVQQLPWPVVQETELLLSEYVQLGGTSLGTGVHAWDAAVGTITSTEQAQQALDLAQRLATDTLPDVAGRLAALVNECGLQRPASIAEWSTTIDLLVGVEKTLGDFEPAVFDLDLVELTTDLAPARKGGMGRALASLFNSRYRRAKKSAASVQRRGLSPSELAEGIETALEQRQRWGEHASDGLHPRLPQSLDQTANAFSALTSQLAAMAAFLGDDQRNSDVEQAQQCARELVDDRTMLFRLPRLHEIRSELEGRSLSAPLRVVVERRLSADDAAALLRGVWLRSSLDLIALTDPEIGNFDGAAHTVASEEFSENDRSHIEDGAHRVLRRAAERAIATLNEHPEQASVIRQQAGRKRGHKSLRNLLDVAPDVLLAVKPCWAMSPLVVSQLLPSDPPLFDVVIFDEASQIRPAEAVPSIMRGRQLIVAGDSRQLPPTTFFSAGAENVAEDDDADLDGLVTDDMESILDSMAALLAPPHGSKTLGWHYRSRDERLIAFSNAQASLYNWEMTTFPGVGTESAVRHVEVPWSADNADQTSSSGSEVEAVVNLVKEHARTRPDETLGIITMGIKHADRISETLRLERALDQVLDDYLTDHPDEPFFVKNLERVQGDERDNIILSIGYGKNADGRMVYRFGPLNQEGGERRLNVAVTRARDRITTVSSFGPQDLDNQRLSAEGAKMLKRYITYAASSGSDLGAVALDRPPLNPFERDVLAHLEAAGIPLTPQLGVSGYWIDFAAAHPDERGSYVLAIEADGATYHSSATARDRDRLRQEHLERLGWTFHRIWSTEWFRNRPQEVQRTVDAWRNAVEAADNDEVDDAEPPPPPSNDDRGADQPDRQLPQPRLRPGEPITEYRVDELDAIVNWIRSDTLLRTDDELLDLTVREMGYRRRGSRIVAAISAAIDRTRPTTGDEPVQSSEPSALRNRSNRPPSLRVPKGPDALAPPITAGQPADWYPDPTGRFEYRYWDGREWTRHASRSGEMLDDPIGRRR